MTQLFIGNVELLLNVIVLVHEIRETAAAKLFKNWQPQQPNCDLLITIGCVKIASNYPKT